ncbi:MAG: PGF-pre-PGF domain-containing protein [Candidatus Aenigmarchaeota archaeon]|nr:PGF-pre-PGF domain-containing protein [Candidatus Aenigmarchaeota archaeon]NIS73416.1 PGF-pre-PGF domain-containing protein [Candidatus Aenigmarchaeota archaeon]
MALVVIFIALFLATYPQPNLTGMVTISVLPDGSNSKNLTFTKAGDQIVYLLIPKNANVINANLNVSGLIGYAFYGIENGGFETGNSLGWINSREDGWSSNNAPEGSCYNTWGYKASTVQKHSGNYSWWMSLSGQANTALSIKKDITIDQINTQLSYWRYLYIYGCSLINFYVYLNHPNGAHIATLEHFDGYTGLVNWTRKTYNIKDYTNKDKVQIEFKISSGNCISIGCHQVYIDDVEIGGAEVYPINPTLDIGNDGDTQWFHSGEFDTREKTPSLSTEINEYLSTCVPDANRECLVPLVFRSESAGTIEISDINITYNLEECSDWTPYNQCSATKPKYCSNGTLVDKCYLCDCPAGKVCRGDGTCVISYYFCQNGDVYKNYTNYTCINSQCQNITTSILIDDCSEADETYCKEGISSCVRDLIFTEAGNQIIYIDIPKKSIVNNATLNLSGLTIPSEISYLCNGMDCKAYSGKYLRTTSDYGCGDPDDINFTNGNEISDYNKIQSNDGIYETSGPIVRTHNYAFTKFIYTLEYDTSRINNITVYFDGGGDASCSGSHLYIYNFPSNTYTRYRTTDSWFETYTKVFDDLSPIVNNSRNLIVVARSRATGHYGVNCAASSPPGSGCGISTDIINVTIKLKTLDTNPTNPFLEVGTPDGIYEWSYLGKFFTLETTPDFSAELNEHLSTCIPDTEFNCTIPLVFHSDSIGRIEIFNMNVMYEYAECLADSDCDDENLCTTDICSESSRTCSNEPVIPCCGDGLCESNETYSNCCLDCSCPTGYICQNNNCISERTEEPGDGSGTITPPGTEPEKPSINITKKINEIVPGEMANITVENNETGVKEIYIEVKNPVKEIDVNIVKFPQKPAQVFHEVAENVYEYLELSMTNVTDENIEKATVGFRVNKTWIAKNNINKTTVKLNRYFNGTWYEMPTIPSGESPEFVYYESDVPGFSIFAITGEEIEEPKMCVPNEKRCSDNNLEQCVTDGTELSILETCEYGCNDETLLCNQPPVIETVMLYFFISSIVIAVMVLYLVIKRKREFLWK